MLHIYFIFLHPLFPTPFSALFTQGKTVPDELSRRVVEPIAELVNKYELLVCVLSFGLVLRPLDQPDVDLTIL